MDWPEFPELHKPADVPCRHLDLGVGCRIHPDRPVHCASFQCLWLMGFGPEALRPDRIGGYFDATDAGLLILLADKDRPDPLALPPVAAFVAAWTARRRARLVVYRAGREVRPPRPRDGRRPRGGPSRPDATSRPST